MPDIAESTMSKIAAVVFGGQCDHRRCVKRVMVRDIGGSSLELWHALDVSDFSTFRSFITTGDGNLYDVDFLSRHEIMPPMSVAKLPAGWEKWAVVYKNQLIITDRDEFCCRMMTPDASVALPTYRFEFLSDDVRAEISSGTVMPEALEHVLKSLVTGYSYKMFSSLHKTEPVFEFVLLVKAAT